MPRTIDLGQIELTKLRGYRWEVRIARDNEGAPYAQVTEVYVVTDDEYSTVPEGQQRLEVALGVQKQADLNRAFRAALLAAATRESVEPESVVPEVAVAL